jgi:DNA-binding HxlR family transcriptional regulator
MTDRNAARRIPPRETPRETPDAPMAAAPAARLQKAATSTSPVALDRVIHERVRLAIVSALVGVRSLSFNELKALLDITDGNLSVHARRLEDAGFITCEKTFVDRMPRTEYQITAAGRAALDAYLDHMESLIRRVRDG